MTSRHFLQGTAWAQFQRDLGKDVVERAGDGWSYQAIVEHGRGSSRLYCPYGPTFESIEALKAALADLRAEAKRRRLVFVRVEPWGVVTGAALRELGLVPARRTVQPPETAVVDLTVTEDDRFAQLPKKQRRTMRVATKPGVTYEVSRDPRDIETFIEHIGDVADRTGMLPHEGDYFRALAHSLVPAGAASFLFAQFEGERVASVIVLHGDETDYYAHAAARSDATALSPARGLVIEAMRNATARGARRFDLFGVAPEDAPADHPWAGFTKFKLSLGSERVKFNGTWELPVNALRFRLYRAALSAAEWIAEVRRGSGTRNVSPRN